MGYIKKVVVYDLPEKTINYEANNALDLSVEVISFDWKVYRGLGKVASSVNQMVVT